MALQYKKIVKNTFVEFVPAVPELKRSKTSPDLTFPFQIEQKHASVDSEAETECRSSGESTEDSLDSPLPTSMTAQRRPLTGPLWADMTDEDEEMDAPVANPAAEPKMDAPVAAEPKMSWADITESDDDEVVPDVAAKESKHAAQEPKQLDQENIDGWTTVVSKKGKKSRR